MSLIHKYLNDNHTSDGLIFMCKSFINEFNKQNSDAWRIHVESKDHSYHRVVLLQQGRCDFDKPPYNLTSEELIVLYNYYYFPMHYQSSYEIFTELIFQEIIDYNSAFFFHDFGCGTLSSTMAFSESLSKSFRSATTSSLDSGFFKFDSHEYSKIDSWDIFSFYFNDEIKSSIESFKTASHTEHLSKFDNFKLPLYLDGYWLNDKSIKIKEYIKKLLLQNFNFDIEAEDLFNQSEQSNYDSKIVCDKFYVGQFDSNLAPFQSFCKTRNLKTNQPTVIINFSYVLASTSIDIKSIENLIKDYQELGCKLVIINQNPDLDSLNKNWEILKSKLHYIYLSKGTIQLKHLTNKSKSRYEVIFPITEKIFINKCKEYFKSKDFEKLDRYLFDLNSLGFKKYVYNELETLARNGHLDICNYILDFANSNGKIHVNYYHYHKAQIYKELGAINLAKNYFELAIQVSDREITQHYVDFIKKYFPHTITKIEPVGKI